VEKTQLDRLCLEMFDSIKEKFDKMGATESFALYCEGIFEMYTLIETIKGKSMDKILNQVT